MNSDDRKQTSLTPGAVLREIRERAQAREEGRREERARHYDAALMALDHKDQYNKELDALEAKINDLRAAYKELEGECESAIRRWDEEGDGDFALRHLRAALAKVRGKK